MLQLLEKKTGVFNDIILTFEYFIEQAKYD